MAVAFTIGTTFVNFYYRFVTTTIYQPPRSVSGMRITMPEAITLVSWAEKASIASFSFGSLATFYGNLILVQGILGIITNIGP